MIIIYLSFELLIRKKICTRIFGNILMRKIIGLFLAFIPKGVVMKSRINEINNNKIIIKRMIEVKHWIEKFHCESYNISTMKENFETIGKRIVIMKSKLSMSHCYKHYNNSTTSFSYYFTFTFQPLPSIYVTSAKLPRIPPQMCNQPFEQVWPSCIKPSR